jgi:hypothetical protein
MTPKSKSRPAGGNPAASTLKTLMLHDVTNRKPPVNVAARRPMVPPPSATGTANHARHHVSRQAQA